MDTTARCRAISAACLTAERSRQARTRYSRVVAALVRIGHGDLLTPHVREAEIMRVLHALAASTEAQSDEGAAIRGTLVRVPRALTLFLRRNNEWLRTQIAAAEKDNAPAG
jgi:hypothetical protein